MTQTVVSVSTKLQLNNHIQSFDTLCMTLVSWWLKHNNFNISVIFNKTI